MAIEEAPRFAGDPMNFGRDCLGPCLVDVARWVRVRSRALVADPCLLFVARDGHLLRQVYDRLHPEDRERSHYVLTSRAAVRCAALADPAAVLRELDDCPRGDTVRNLLISRFHLLDGPDAPIDPMIAEVLADPRTDLRFADPAGAAFLRACVTRLAPLVAARATRHREHFARYLCDIVGSRDPVVVDLGYRGTSQRHFAEVLDRPVAGLYLVTHAEARTLPATVGPIEGWDGDFVSPRRSTSFVSEHRYVFETVLSADTGAFHHFDPDGRPVHAANPQSAVSREIRARIHAGVVRAAEAAVRPAEWPLVSLRDFLVRPAPADAALFAGLAFEDAYAGAPNLFIVAPPQTRDDDFAVWIEGQEASDRHHGRVPPGRSWYVAWERLFVEPRLPKSKYAQYHTNRPLWLARGRHPLLRFYAATLRILGL